MDNDLSDYRKSYEKGELRLENMPQNPIEFFRNWFLEVDMHYDIAEVNAMTISTIGLDGYPKSRVVLLKKYSDEGFIFYTNYNSDKGQAIEENEHVCLSFFWHAAERQIIIKGKAEKVAKEVSDSYFNSRPRGSKLGALVSNQSEIIKSREVLERKLNFLKEDYRDKPIERPEHWGGFIVKPVEIEFWQGRPNRLHDRIRYQIKEDSSWTIVRLSP